VESVAGGRRITLVVEVPEDTDLEELLDVLRREGIAVKEDPVERLRRLFSRVDRNPVRVGRIPGREEVYDRA